MTAHERDEEANEVRHHQQRHREQEGRDEDQ
jgi:hypothetical protein